MTQCAVTGEDITLGGVATTATFGIVFSILPDAVGTKLNGIFKNVLGNADDGVKIVSKNADEVLEEIKVSGGGSTDAEISCSEFQYKHNPSNNPKVLEDAIENQNAIFGYSPNLNSKSLSGYADAIDWSSPIEVAEASTRREAYHIKNDSISELVIKMKSEGYSEEKIAQEVNEQRNLNRLNDYINDQEGLARVKLRNMIKYQNENGPTAEYLFNKYGSWDKVIEKSMSANPGMDACCGLYDKYYHLYDLE